MLFVPSAKAPQRSTFDASQLIWALGSICAVHQRHFSPEMLAQEFPLEALSDGDGSKNGKNSHTKSTLLPAFSKSPRPPNWPASTPLLSNCRKGMRPRLASAALA